MKAFDIRTLLGALLLFGVIASGFILWYHHQRTKLAEEDSTFKQRRENVSPETAEHADETEGTSHSDAEPSTAENAEPETADEDVPVSPYGFGPYPPLPEGWGPETWNNISANHELMARVEVKLISQGINVEGSAMEDGLVYPIIKGILYVKWRTYPGPNGVETYISDTLGHPDDGARIASIKEERGMDFTADDIPSDIKLVPFEEGGINPYDFLGLYKDK